MTTNQGQLQENIRAITGTSLDYNGDWHALFDNASIAAGAFNDRLGAYLQTITSSASTNLNDLKARFAQLQGADNWNSALNILPSMITSGEAWLADDFETTDALVDSWNDLFDNDNNGVAAGGLRPTATNGVVTFDGTDALILPSSIYSVPNGANTMFIVSKRASEDASIDALINFADGANNVAFIIYGSAAGAITSKNRVSAGGALSNTGNTNTEFQSIRVRRDGVNQFNAVNNGLEETNAFAQNASGVDEALIGFANGGAFPFIGDIKEIIIYSKSLSVIERNLVESYLNAKHNLY